MRKNIHQKSKPVTAADIDAPAQEPLGEFEPNIYTTALCTLEAFAKLISMLKAIEHIADWNVEQDINKLRQKLCTVYELADIAGYIGHDEHNTNDCRIARCMLASEDPEIRKEARP